MKIIITLALLLISAALSAAAPNDITSNQRAWFDGVDINGNNNYTDNPTDNSLIPLWNDKSGSANHISNSGSEVPYYRHNSIGTERHGLDFDGANDQLINASDIWTGAVSQSEIFIVATTDRVQASALFSSTDSSRNRISIHLPWNNGITFFDHGFCCSPPSRLFGAPPIPLSLPFVMHTIGLPSLQSVVRDGKVLLTDTGAGVYNTLPASSFSMAGWAGTSTFHHDGKVYEGIFYQTELNNAQRRILSSYLSAKWNKTFDASPDYADTYQGDEVSNGDYDFFVGGIGQDSGTQIIGTSQGLTISNNNFLNANGKFVVAGVNYLTNTPTTGLSTTDLPSPYTDRSNRTWYIDTTGTGGLVNLRFNAASIGIPVENGLTYGLLHRTGTSGTFTEVATATMTGGMINFSHLPADGIYSVAKRGEVKLEFKKTSLVISDPVNSTTNPKSIPGALVDYTLIVKNSGDGSADLNTINISDNLTGNLILFTGNLDGSGNPFVFVDDSCPPTTNTLSSNLSINYPSAVTYKNGAGTVVSPSSDFDAGIRSFIINMSGIFSASDGINTPCFTIQYRTRIE